MSTEMTTMDTTAPLPRPASRRRIPSTAYGLLVIAVFGGVIGIGMASGAFQTTGRTTEGGGRVASQGETVAEIKGWMAIGDVADAWSVPLPELLAAFELPSDTPASTPLKELESDRFSVQGLREWLAARDAAAP
jgi:hypothetical protein